MDTHYLLEQSLYLQTEGVHPCLGLFGIADVWWVKHGTGTPALQSFASLILGQTCFGASRYNLDKSLSERLHTERRAYTEQERFRSMEYIYYNLRLASSVPRVAGPPADQHSKLTTHLGDWLSA